MIFEAVLKGLPQLAQATGCPSAHKSWTPQPLSFLTLPGHPSHQMPLTAQGQGAASGWAPSHPPHPALGHSSGPFGGSRGQALKEQGEPQAPSEHTKRRKEVGKRNRV